MILLVLAEGVDGFDQPDCADGNEILNVYARVFKFLCNIHDQPEIVFNQYAPGALVVIHEPFRHLVLLFRCKRRRKHVCTVDVVDHRRADPTQPVPEPEQAAVSNFSSVSSIPFSLCVLLL